MSRKVKRIVKWIRRHVRISVVGDLFAEVEEEKEKKKTRPIR